MIPTSRSLRSPCGRQAHRAGPASTVRSRGWKDSHLRLRDIDRHGPARLPTGPASADPMDDAHLLSLSPPATRTGRAVLFRRPSPVPVHDDRRMYEMIRLHVDAPAKPAAGSPCNGCGVCCTSEPCPLGMVVSRRTTGRCDALLWQEDQARYRCGLIEQPSAYLHPAMHWARPLVTKMALRYISAGSGCDCDVTLGAR